MESNGIATVSPLILTPSKAKHSTHSKFPENVNPNISNPNPKPSNSPITKSGSKILKSEKKVNPIGSPKNKIRERKFVVAKKRSRNNTVSTVECKCVKAVGNGTRCLCVAYESLRASQKDFFKVKCEEEVMKTEGNEVEGKVEEEEYENVETSGEKRRREKVVEVEGVRRSIPEPGSGKVMDLIKAFENKLVLPKADDEDDVKVKVEEEGELKWDEMSKFSASSFCVEDLLLTAENLGLGAHVSSSLDSNHGSVLNRNSGGRQRRRKSSESTSSFGSRRWKRTTSQQPFKLRTEQRGRSKQEEFIKKVQEMKTEEEKQRIPVAQGLPWTTDEPECLVKPPVKESTRPIDLVLHSDVRAVERAEFDQHVQVKLSYIEQYKLEREMQQKLEEEEELKRLRKELVPKAQPMPYFDRPFIPRRSEKQPTIPKEPKFHNPQHKKVKGCMSLNGMYTQCPQQQ